MSWNIKTLVISPGTLRRLVAQGVANLGPGPRGVTITHRRMRLDPFLRFSALGPDSTRSYQITEVLRFEGVPSIKLTRRIWE